MGHLAGMVAALLLGIGVAHAAMPALARTIPTDLSRIGVLLDALRSADPPPRIAVLGSSVAMAGVDARQLSGELPDRPLAWNLASTGQTLAESYLLLDALPKQVGTVVQFVTGQQLASPDMLDPQKYSLYAMNGYRPSAHARERLEAAGGAAVAAVLESSDASQRFRARWTVRQLVDGGMRRLLRRDLALEKAEHDLYFPQPYTSRFPDGLRRRAIRRWIAVREKRAGGIRDDERALLETLAADVVHRGARLVLVLAPVDPAVRRALGASAPERTLAALEAVGREPGVTLLRLDTLLPEDEFIDHIHPTTDGARRVTRRVADAIRSG